ncbi:MAG: hypothetical protein Q8N05_10070 [Bacteroidota bacterium]|nr:hypothetical protein [Bacteroidota bacterium]
MENNDVPDGPKRKTSKDFILLFLALAGLVAALLLIKFAIGALHLI